MRFTLATIAAYLLVFLAAFAGGVSGWLALGAITVLVFVLDRVIARDLGNADPEAEFPAADRLLTALALLHFLALITAIPAVAGDSGLVGSERAVVALTAALVMGQISHPVAHELIHRPSRHLRLLGKLIYTSILFGHHASAHLRVHHVHVGSKGDPNSARWGEGFWRFLRRAWPGGFLAGLRAENRLRHSRGTALSHPYTLYIGGAVAMGALCALLAGVWGVASLIFISLYAQIQIFLSDYVQHYGLRRATLASGRLEPVGPQHSWNAPYACSSAMTLNAPRHSDHHVTPARPYPALQMRPADMPTLPHSLPVMAVLALFPPLWRRIMDPLCKTWQAHATHATGGTSPRQPEPENAAGAARPDLSH